MQRSFRGQGPLEGEVVAVGVGDGEAAHVVASDHGLLQNGHAEGKKLVEGGVHVGAAEEERGVGVCSDAGGIGSGRAFTFVISGVEHDPGVAAAQHAPMEVVALRATDDGRVADEFEAQDFVIELHGCRHVEDL